MSRRKLQICFCEDEFTWLTYFTEKHLFSIVTRQARKQHSPWDIMLSLQTTDRSKVDIRTKRGISHPHYTLISHLPQQKVAGGLTKKKKSCQTENRSLSHGIYFLKHVLTFPSVVVASQPDDFLSRAVDIFSSVSGECVDFHLFFCFFLFFFMAIKTSYYSRDVGQSVSVAMTHIQMVPVPKPNQSVSTALTKEK